MKFTKKEMRSRAIKRIAEILHDHWEEGRDGHSRTFEVIVPDEFVIDGQSINGGSYREHVVPCATLREGSKAMYERGATIEDVASTLDKYLRIVLITNEEAHRLDVELGLKTTMPKGWDFGDGDALARLIVAGIELA